MHRGYINKTKQRELATLMRDKEMNNATRVTDAARRKSDTPCSIKTRRWTYAEALEPKVGKS